jgi:hypothetical protein
MGNYMYLNTFSYYRPDLCCNSFKNQPKIQRNVNAIELTVAHSEHKGFETVRKSVHEAAIVADTLLFLFYFVCS